ncbi:MAG: hypothetical protein A2X35_03590 [Elusimicrobia bacterium GWA2_61_42]|nr:MAG: hypothetical protein A2X35_03590 [Elusimicrobia bacterium GWA2_61_42]OGR77663.1 MAG: hypothetical protein A2X38_09830 [Elusimicrobia bacterium GWC2_61_25]
MLKLLAAAAIFLTFASALPAQQALLWIPAGGQAASEIIALLESSKDLRLTAAFAELPKDLEERVKKLSAEGRLELALRPAGDPPLPLLYGSAEPEVRWAGKPSTATLSNDPYFLSLRLSLARDAAFKALKKAPGGLINTPGGLTPDYFPLARAMGLKWLATGPLASTAAAVLEADGVYAVPFVRYSTAAPAGPAPAFLVFDETLEPDPAWLRAALAAALADPAAQGRLTVSEALALAVSSRATPAEIAGLSSPWSGDYTAWASTPAQAGALTALTKTRSDLMLHLNSFQGNYKPAAAAFEEYFSAEEGVKLRALAEAGSEAGRETEIEIQNALGNAYRLMQKPPPPWIFSGLADAAVAGKQTDKPETSVKDGGFEITNVARKPEVPAGGPQLSKTADPYQVWKLSSMKVAAGSDNLVFSFTPAALENPGRYPSGFSHIRLDLYIDINHRPRAGMSRPLEGRPLRLFPDNAWEYALEITPERAVLYTVTPKGPVPAGTFKPKAAGGAVTVSVPRAALKGSPLLWGYAALLLAPDGVNKFTITDYIAADISNGYIYALRPGRK